MREAIETALRPLVGLQLSILQYAGNMRIFQFGETTSTARGTVGKYALHVQCPWRIQQADKIITASGDWYQRADGNEADLDSWDPGRGGSVQELRLRALLNCPADESRSLVNTTGNYFVTEVAADDLGGCQITFSGDLLLVLFPCGSTG